MYHQPNTWHQTSRYSYKKRLSATFNIQIGAVKFKSTKFEKWNFVKEKRAVWLCAFYDQYRKISNFVLPRNFQMQLQRVFHSSAAGEQPILAYVLMYNKDRIPSVHTKK